MMALLIRSYVLKWLGQIHVFLNSIQPYGWYYL